MRKLFRGPTNFTTFWEEAKLLSLVLSNSYIIGRVKMGDRREGGKGYRQEVQGEDNKQHLLCARHCTKFTKCTLLPCKNLTEVWWGKARYATILQIRKWRLQLFHTRTTEQEGGSFEFWNIPPLICIVRKMSEWFPWLQDFTPSINGNDYNLITLPLASQGSRLLFSCSFILLWRINAVIKYLCAMNSQNN